MEIVKYKNCQFEKNQLIIADEITKEEWLEIGSGLSKIEGSVQMWIGDWARFGEKKGYYTDSKTYKEISEITGYKPSSIKQFKYVADNVQSSMRIDDMSFSHLQQIAPFSPEKQVEYTNMVVEEHLSVKELKKEIRKDQKQLEVQELPNGIYNVFYIDPPWQYSNSGLGGSAEKHYSTMSMEDLGLLPIPSISDNNSICFMWVTNPMLKDGLTLLSCWGFEYKTNMVWFKEKQTYGLLGFYVYGQHEILLIGVRGSMLPIGEMFSSVIKAGNIIHSKKPEIVYEIIEKMYPGCKYVELFARNKKTNWESWGNQI